MLAAALMQPHHLRSKTFGLDFQRYSEQCQIDLLPLSGLYMIGSVYARFDVDKDKGHYLSELELFSIEAPTAH